jgi:hypothetical protein
VDVERFYEDGEDAPEDKILRRMEKVEHDMGDVRRRILDLAAMVKACVKRKSPGV